MKQLPKAEMLKIQVKLILDIVEIFLKQINSQRLQWILALKQVKMANFWTNTLTDRLNLLIKRNFDGLNNWLHSVVVLASYMHKSKMMNALIS